MGQCNENDILVNFARSSGQRPDSDKLHGSILERLLESFSKNLWD
jgi:hypothetical protein